MLCRSLELLLCATQCSLLGGMAHMTHRTRGTLSKPYALSWSPAMHRCRAEKNECPIATACVENSGPRSDTLCHWADGVLAIIILLKFASLNARCWDGHRSLTVHDRTKCLLLPYYQPWHVVLARLTEVNKRHDFNNQRSCMRSNIWITNLWQGFAGVKTIRFDASLIMLRKSIPYYPWNPCPWDRPKIPMK